MKPRASASFCHCPCDSSTPLVPRGPELGVEAVRRAGRRHRRPPARPRPPRAAPRGRRCAARRRRRPSRGRGARSGRSPGTRPPAARRHAVTGERARSARPPGSVPLVGAYSRHSSFTSVVLPAPFSPTMATTAPAGSVERHVVEHEPIGARVAERHVLEARCPSCEPSGTCTSRRGVGRGGVVLEPREPPRRVEPDAAQEPELADRGTDVLRQP